MGPIVDAKRELARCLRGSSRARPRAYEESDGPRIATKVRELGIIGDVDAVSLSYERFKDGVGAHPTSDR